MLSSHLDMIISACNSVVTAAKTGHGTTPHIDSLVFMEKFVLFFFLHLLPVAQHLY